MKSLITTIFLSASLSLSLNGQGKSDQTWLSLKLEIAHAIKTGNEFLFSKQTDEGYWDDPKITALSALPLTAILRDPSLDNPAQLPPKLEKGYQWLLSNQKADGGIYGKGLATYNTSTSMMAILARAREEDKPALLKARAFLINQQTDWGNKGVSDNEFDGGIGYGGTYAHSDLSNTHLALEALYHSRKQALDSDSSSPSKEPDLDWEAALKFISSCQNHQDSNPRADSGNDGGFVYFPGNSKAGESTDKEGIKTHNSYGSISYAGLLSLIYADLEADDPRVIAVKNWLAENFTLEENPGVGQQGLYYYYQAMAKALAAANVDQLESPKGKEINWRHDLAETLLQNQQADGSWINNNSRWWENNPILVTSYAVLTLEQIYYTLP